MSFTVTDEISSYYYLRKVKIGIEKRIQIKNFDFSQNVEPTNNVENFKPITSCNYRFNFYHAS